MENSQVRTFNNPRFINNKSSAMQFNEQATYFNILNRLTVLAQSIFKWEDTPPELTSRVIEQGLFRHGSIAFYRDKSEDTIYSNRFMALPYTYTSLDVYGDPVGLQAYGLNGYYAYATRDVDAVIIRNNIIGTNNYDTIDSFARRITTALLTQDLNIYQQRSSVLYLVEESQVTTMKNIMNSVKLYEPYVLGVANALDIDKKIRVINNNVPYIADKLTTYKNDLWEEILTFFGITTQDSKRERLITAEVQSNNQFANASLNTMYESRIEASDAINRMFGLNVKPVMTNYQEDVLKFVNGIADIGGEPNE